MGTRRDKAQLCSSPTRLRRPPSRPRAARTGWWPGHRSWRDVRVGGGSASSESAAVRPITQDPLLTLAMALGKGVRVWWRPLPCPELLRFCPPGAQRTPPTWLVPRASGAGEPILPADGPPSAVGPGGSTVPTGVPGPGKTVEGIHLPGCPAVFKMRR